jgi:hypothetical protein
MANAEAASRVEMAEIWRMRFMGRSWSGWMNADGVAKR